MADLASMWRALEPVGRTPAGYRRRPFDAAERELAAWFVEECTGRELDVEVDGLGNVVAWWGPADAPAVLTGSHLDSVPDGGAFDGPLGVVSALAALDELRSRGVRPTRRLGISVFVEEEGSRFGLACLGSRLVTGALDDARARDLRDAEGRRLPDVLEASGLGGLDAPRLSLEGVEAFVELHVEQGRGLVDLDAPVAVAAGIWPHGRWRFAFDGTPDHAGTTRMEDRADPMLTYAVTALAAAKAARLAGQRATFGRVSVEPNATNGIAARVTAWLDARGEHVAALEHLVDAISAQALARAERDGTSVVVTPESLSPAVHFPPALAARTAPGLPSLPTQAGHDAGVLAEAGIPTAMLFVRNPTGVSHSPLEHAGMADCEAGVVALADALERLVGDPA